MICLDDMLILSHKIQEAHRSRDTVIYLLQYLGFTIKAVKPLNSGHLQVLKNLSVIEK